MPVDVKCDPRHMPLTTLVLWPSDAVTASEDSPQSAIRGRSRFQLGPEVLAPRGLYCSPCILAWRPHPPARLPPTHFPARLVITPVFDIQGYSCLVTQTFRAFIDVAVQDCRLQLPPGTRVGFFPISTTSAMAIESRDWKSLASPWPA